VLQIITSAIQRARRRILILTNLARVPISGRITPAAYAARRRQGTLRNLFGRDDRRLRFCPVPAGIPRVPAPTVLPARPPPPAGVLYALKMIDAGRIPEPVLGRRCKSVMRHADMRDKKCNQNCDASTDVHRALHHGTITRPRKVMAHDESCPPKSALS
jgi:hypothetical protein